MPRVENKITRYADGSIAVRMTRRREWRVYSYALMISPGQARNESRSMIAHRIITARRRLSQIIERGEAMNSPAKEWESNR